MPENLPDGAPSAGSGVSRPGGTVGAGGWAPPSVEELQESLLNYEIIRILGRGGMGAVYEGRQLSLDRLVAIKVLPPEALNQVGGEDAVERFRNEARSMARMNHPGIVGVYDFGATTRGQLYLVMEHVDGTDVAQMIRSQGRLPDEHALSIIVHVCDALQYAHAHGVIHRDIKPANILLNREGQVKIADFGLAKGTDAGATGITRTNITMGTPDFIAPEALIEGLTVDQRSDIYSVGVMLYNMLTGEVPRGAFKLPSVKSGSDPRFDAIIVKAIQSEREDRYPTAQEMRRDLDVILAIPAAKVKTAARVADLGQGVPAKTAPRPVSTGPRTAATGQKPLAGVSRPVGAAATSAQGALAPRDASPPTRRSGSKRLPRGVPPSKSPALLFGGIAAVLVLGGAGWWNLRDGGSKPTPSVAAAPAEAAKVAAAPVASQPKTPSPAPSGGGGGLPPKITELREVPHNRWFSILAAKEAVAGKTNVEWKDGWVDCRANSEVLGFTALGGRHEMQNIALKGVVRPPGPGKEWMWTFREGARGGYRLVVRADRLELDYEDRTEAPARTVHLREGSFPMEVAKAPQWSLEAMIRGDRFSVSLNGREIFSLDKLKLLEPGLCWLRPGGAGHLICKDVSFKILDDTATVPNAGSPGPPAAGAAPKDSAAGAPPQPAAVESDKRLAEIAAQFKTAYDRDIGKPHAAALADFDGKYIAALESALAEATRDGRPDEAAKLRAEKKRIGDKQPLPPVDADASLPGALKRLRGTYRSSLMKMEAERDRKAQPYYDRYDQLLDAYEKELTQQRKLDDAARVKAIRAEWWTARPKAQPDGVSVAK